MVIQFPRRGEATASAANSIVLRIPRRLKHLVAPIKKLVDALHKRTLQVEQDGRAIDYAAIEREWTSLVGAIESAANLCTLEAVAIEAQQIEVGGKLYTRVADGFGTYRTMTGPVQLKRGLFRAVGERNAKTVDIISLRTGAVGDGWLPHTAQAMAHYLQLGTSREAARATRHAGRLPYSRASFERVPHLVGELWLEHHADIEDALVQSFDVPKEAASISIAIDRASVPMEEAVQRKPGRPRKNAPKRSIRRAYRMCYCATVTLHDGDGKALHTVRRAQMPGFDPQDLCSLMANDVRHLREKRPDLAITLLADGAPEMWNLLEAAFPVEVFGPVHRFIDFWHAIEKLAAATKIVGKNDLGAARTLHEWRHMLLQRKHAAASILEQLEASGEEQTTVDGCRPVHDAITYFRNNLVRMDYVGAIRKGLPIGSGNVEATCKAVVNIRMKRCGSRWHTNTGNHVLHLRALALSDRWDDAMDKLFAKRRTAVRRRAA